MTPRKLALDDRRRASLAKFGRREHSEYLVDEQPDGTLVLTPAVTISAEELAVMRNPGLMNTLTRGLERRELRSRGDFTQYAD